MILELHHIQLAMPEGREQDARAFYSGFSVCARSTSLKNCARVAECGLKVPASSFTWAWKRRFLRQGRRTRPSGWLT